jgi:HprK-related kinase B
MRRPDCVFISNDRLMIQPCDGGLEMTGVAKQPRINPGTALNNPNLTSILSTEDRARFSSLPESELWDLEHKVDVPLDHCFGTGRFSLKAPMKGLVLLNWKRNQAPLTVGEVDLSQRRDLLPAFMKSTGLFFLKSDTCGMPEPTEDAYIDMLSRCKVWEFSGGADFEEAGRQCRKLLELPPAGSAA